MGAPDRLHEFEERLWDCVILGAGPAGAMAALLLARQGHAVLLCDKALFPRYKVCGCCLNADSLAYLDAAGITENRLLAQGAIATQQLMLANHSAVAALPLPRGMALSRAALDSLVVEEAARNGVVFVDGIHGSIQSIASDSVTIALKSSETETVQVHAKIALVATGLSGRPVAANLDWPDCPQANSRIGAGAILDVADPRIAPGEIWMVCGQHGYAGAVRVEQGRLNVGAALEANFVRECGGLAGAIASVLREGGFAQDFELNSVAIRGTAALSHALSRVAFPRVFVLGDAAGYVEPFTGQGMAWALRGATLLAPLAQRAIVTWQDALAQEWQTLYLRDIRRRQRTCALLARTLRHPWLTREIIGLLSHVPWAAQPVIHALASNHLRIAEVRA